MSSPTNGERIHGKIQYLDGEGKPLLSHLSPHTTVSRLCITSSKITFARCRPAIPYLVTVCARPLTTGENRIWMGSARMDLTPVGSPQPPPTPAPLPTQTLQVNPDNVVELAVMFSQAADHLEAQIAQLEQDLWLPEPWLHDPVSGWVWSSFNTYFVHGENSFAKVVFATYQQHVANADALAKAAAHYGKGDELHAALLRSQLPR
jgi:hypothetical protein